VNIAVLVVGAVIIPFGLGIYSWLHELRFAEVFGCVDFENVELISLILVPGCQPITVINVELVLE